MAVYPNTATLKWIENRQSRYGCGSYQCVDCYPIQYGCDECGNDFDRPVFVTRWTRLQLCPDCHWEGEVKVK